MAIPSIAAHRHFLEFVFTPSVPYRLLVMTSTESIYPFVSAREAADNSPFGFPILAMQIEHFIYRMISCFLWVVNAAIQPLEKSASKLLICNGRIFSASAGVFKKETMNNLADLGEKMAPTRRAGATSLRGFDHRLEEIVETEIILVSVGADRDQTIVLKNPFHT